MIYLITFTIIYILSAWRSWWWIRMAYYHPEGKWKSITPNNDEYFVTFFPIINTGFCVVTLFGRWKRKQYTDNNIFKPKKPLT